MDNKSQAFNTRMITYFLGFISAVVFVYILMALKGILIPITIAVFLTFFFHPILDFLNIKLKIPKPIALIIIFIFNFGMFYLLGLLVASNVRGFTERTEFYAQNLSLFLSSLLKPFNLTLREFADFLNVQLETLDTASIMREVFDSGILQSVFSSFSSMLGDFFIVMIFWIFMIMGKAEFDERLKLAFTKNKSYVDDNLKAINAQLQSYILYKTLISFITGAAFTLILLIYNIDFALFWGFLAFLLNYIPNIGSLLATIFPILIALLEYGLGLSSISLTVLLVGVQFVMGNIVEPKFLGEKMDLSPVFVLFSLFFWGWLWGIVGMFLAVPIAAVIKIFCSNIEPLKPIAVLIGTKKKIVK
ncbi:MAG: AI-2E family transporter [Ignavibacterium sp.]|nr:AI-2E family transporter [Ignavibacterium sp.]